MIQHYKGNYGKVSSFFLKLKRENASELHLNTVIICLGLQSCKTYLIPYTFEGFQGKVA